MNANKNAKLQDMNTRLMNLKEVLQKKTRQPYMSKIIRQPYIDEDKLLLIMFIVDNLQIPKFKADKYIITTMLVQIALDTHESVQNDPLPLERLKGRQLTILAGTYYSGLYYQILAEIDDIFMIRTLAEGIMEVNEHKVSVYSHDRDTVESLMESLKKTESSLFDRITHFYNRSELGELAANLVFINRVLLEKKRFLASKPSILFDALSKLFETEQNVPFNLPNNKQRLINICDKYVSLSFKEIEKSIDKCEHTELFREKLKWMKSHQQEAVQSFVEEG
ncbi:heptaprenyl diphosphate synthase component 1 [Cytobacillus sp. Sa5YUA1]|uniref:Heptaprenyl diphosphate synthase component 1 n=1 Tax=Cytobacillus stercorigallinarum TaxID=2762240 RepID=A0ABR8QKL4_9BACI|nr:heptaprenyl diphosphate synthase component 1 [Cytobacillus stercorigallinarum]MBD7936063.1 heptaprenyl diphosphate synthase component 1 [Cytobacillus stercorigallinarum]